MLHGRDAEARAIEDLLAGAKAGHSGVLVIRGEAGIGKSALLDFAARSAVRHGTVLRATATETEAELPYSGLHLLLRPLLGKLAGLPVAQADALRHAFRLAATPAGQADDVFLVGLAVLSLLTDAAVEAPVVCLVDDAHWLDDTSATALLFAARRLGMEGVVVIVTTRDPVAGLPQLDLEPLSEDAASKLAGDLDPLLRKRVLAEAAGNPLAITELARVVAGTGPPRYEQPGPLPAGQRMQRLYAEQLAALPEAARTLLLLAAAAGSAELPLVLAAARLAGLDATGLAPAERAGLVSITGDLLSFRHPLVRSAVYHGAPLASRQAAHRMLAQTLADAGPGDLGRRAWHLACAAAARDDEAATALEQAAEEAQQVGGSVAVAAAYERAAELTTDPAVRARRLLAAAAAANDLGQFERVESLLNSARDLPQDDGSRAEACYLRSRSYGSDHTANLAALAQAARAIAATQPRRAAHLLRFTVVSARNFGLPDLAASAIGTLTSISVPAAAAAGPPAPHEQMVAAGEAFWRGDHDETLRISAELAAQCRERGMVNWLAGALHCQVMPLIAVGDWAEARVLAREALRLATDIGQLMRACHCRAQLAILAMLAGDGPDCQSWLDAFAESLTTDDGWGYLTAIPAVLDLSRGKYDTALARFRASLHETWQAPTMIWCQPDIVEAAARGGDRGWALAVTDVFGGWADGIGRPWALGVAARCRALAQPAEAEPAIVEHFFVKALQFHDGCGRPLETARTQLVYGEWLRRLKRRTEAARQLIDAVQTFEVLGAAAWAARARAELAATGQAAARAQAPGVLARLTPQEYQIVRLAAQGESNREIAAQLFLSHRTVSYHLYKAFPKLGVTSRAELADLG